MIAATGVMLGVMTLTLPSNANFEVTAKPSSNPLTINEIKNYIINESVKFGINPELSLCIVKNESQFQAERVGDKDFKGVSLGWWQINTWYHKEITQEFAFNLASSTQWSLTQIKNGHANWWSTYKRYCKSIPVYKKAE